MNNERSNPMGDVALVAVFAALIAAFSIVPAVAIPVSPVPITLQTLAVALTAMIIGPWRGAAATVLYLLVGFAGLPVFASGASGLSVLAKGSVGYLLSFPLYAVVVGLLSAWFVRRGLKFAALTLFVAGLIGNLAIVYPMGIAGMHLNLGLEWGKAFALNLPFVPGDTVKAAAAALIAVAVHKAFPALLSVRVPATRPAFGQQ